MTPWRHILCSACYERRNRRRAVPKRIQVAERCCGCGERTKSGIYVDGEAGDFMCRGEHGSVEAT